MISWIFTYKYSIYCILWYSLSLYWIFAYKHRYYCIFSINIVATSILKDFSYFALILLLHIELRLFETMYVLLFFFQAYVLLRIPLACSYFQSIDVSCPGSFIMQIHVTMIIIQCIVSSSWASNLLVRLISSWRTPYYFIILFHWDV